MISNQHSTHVLQHLSQAIHCIYWSLCNKQSRSNVSMVFVDNHLSVLYDTAHTRLYKTQKITNNKLHNLQQSTDTFRLNEPNGVIWGHTWKYVHMFLEKHPHEKGGGAIFKSVFKIQSITKIGLIEIGSRDGDRVSVFIIFLLMKLCT
jgi:hypothetical protein